MQRSVKRRSPQELNVESNNAGVGQAHAGLLLGGSLRGGKELAELRERALGEHVFLPQVGCQEAVGTAKCIEGSLQQTNK